MNLYRLQSILNLTSAFVTSCCVQVEQGNAGMGEDRRCTNSGSSPCRLLYIFLNFGTILMDSKMNNIIILQHKSLVLFSNQFKSSNWPPLFVINLKNWYLSKTISFLKCPFIPTFLLIIARRCDQKNRNVFSQGPICLGVFCPHFKSDIHKHNRRSDVKLHNIYFFYFLKKKK